MHLDVPVAELKARRARLLANGGYQPKNRERSVSTGAAGVRCDGNLCRQGCGARRPQADGEPTGRALAPNRVARRPAPADPLSACAGEACAATSDARAGFVPR